MKLSIEGSIEVQSQDTSPINVYLRNVNEHSPVVAMDPFSVTMSADVPIGGVIGKLPLVSDLDGQNDFVFSLVTGSPFGYVCEFLVWFPLLRNVYSIFRLNNTGFVYLKYPLDNTPPISSYSLIYTIVDKPLLSVTQTSTATIVITVTPASVPPGLFTCLFTLFTCLFIAVYLFVYFVYLFVACLFIVVYFVYLFVYCCLLVCLL